MEDSEDDARYPPNPYSSNNYHQNYGSSSHRPKLPVRNAYAHEYGDDEEEDDEEVEEEEEEENGVQRSLEDVDENEEEEDIEDDEGDDDDDDDDGDGDKYHRRRTEAGENSDRSRKRRKLRSSAMAYEFAPRVAAVAPSVVAAAAAANAPKAKSPYDHCPHPDWSEPLTFMLIDAWGAFLQNGKKSLRSDEWVEVAKKISQVAKTAMTEAQCRNRLHTLKKKYKTEKAKLDQNSNYHSPWAYFRKLDKYLSPPPRQPGLSCGLDSGEYVYMDRNVYLDRTNVMDEMRDSPGNSESSEGDEEHSDGLPPKKGRYRRGCDERSSFRLLADSIQKFGEIYEKIENNKRQQMLELEKMRMEFHRDLEIQKKQIMERAQAEIAKLQHDDEDDDGDDDEIDVSAENTSE